MKILHIGDIHLGCHLDNYSRNAELQKVFEFLAKSVQEQGIQAALLAGDVFDTGRPSAESQELYYGFLLKLQRAGCRHVVVIAGNHDNPDFLDAPSGLLKQVDIHVVGNVEPGHLEKEVIALDDGEGNVAAYVCAVPFLRARDVCGEVTSDFDGDNSERLASGISQHYKAVYDLAVHQRGEKRVPIIGMGHLYALGSSFRTSDERETVGKLESVNLEDFGCPFDYMALGHIHKPQYVPGHENWRYGGSLLAMNIEEHPSAPQVILLDTEHISQPKGVEIPDSCFHAVKFIQGDLAQLQSELEALHTSGQEVWVKAVYTGEENLPNWAIDLKLHLKEQTSSVQIVASEIRRPIPQASGADTLSTPGEYQEEELVPLSQRQPVELVQKYLDDHQDETTAEQRKKFMELYQKAQNEVYAPSENQEASHCPGKGLLKFKRLYIKNVNSLYGENLIDFEDPAFHSGIFLITGATGAGKSSILDAICLALYGETPRAEKINNTQNPVMSTGAKEMEVSLTFSIGIEEYRAVILQKRTRETSQKPFGALGWTLYKNNMAVTTLSTKTEEKIQELIGLSKTQFTQCVLLAQGSFNAFLQEKGDKRADILSKITQTGIYNTIGAKVNELKREVNAQKERQQGLLNSFTLLDDEQVKKLQEELAFHNNALEENLKSQKSCEEIERLFGAIAAGKEQVQEAEKAQAAALKAKAEAAGDQERLKSALQAQQCEAEYNAWNIQERAMKEVQTQEKELLKAKSELEEVFQNANNANQAAEKALFELEQKQESEQILFQKVREIDTKIDQLTEQIKLATNKLEAGKTEAENARRAFSKAEKIWNAEQEKAAEASAYLAAHEADTELDTLKAGWEPRRVALVALETQNAIDTKEVETTDATLKTAEFKLGETRKALQKAKRQLIEKQAEHDGRQKEREQLLAGNSVDELRELKAAACKLEDFFKDNNSRKAFLTAGKPCPLCGSIVHPYCDGTATPAPHDYSLEVAELEGALKAIANLETGLRRLEKDIATLEKEVAVTAESCKNQENALQTGRIKLAEQQERLSANLAKTEADFKQLEGEIQAALQVEWREHSVLPAELNQRMAAFVKAKNSIEQLQEAKKKFLTAKTVYDTQEPKNEAAIKDFQSALTGLEIEYKTLQKNRRALFGTESVDVREKAALKALKTAQAVKEQSTAVLTKAKNDLEHNQTALEQNETKLVEFHKILTTQSQKLQEKLVQCGFDDIDVFLFKRMDPKSLQELQKKLNHLNTELAKASSTLIERQKVLEENQKKLPAEGDRKKNQETLDGLKATQKTLANERMGLELALHQDRENKTRSQEAQKELNRLCELSNSWTYLDNHFGGEKGKNFAQIAQAYTFRSLLHCANKNRLTFLQNHFTLINDRQNPLELNVIDHYRGDQIRSSRNLSGGEQFEVSLALALGLANMSAVSQNASLGNVLLDEGFGTLDNDALDSALELLAQLNQADGKLVGIISHVEKLRDKIPTQIRVSTSSGMGTLEGAGVKNVEAVRCEWTANHPEYTEKARGKAMKAVAKKRH